MYTSYSSPVMRVNTSSRRIRSIGFTPFTRKTKTKSSSSRIQCHPRLNDEFPDQRFHSSILPNGDWYQQRNSSTVLCRSTINQTFDKGRYGFLQNYKRYHTTNSESREFVSFFDEVDRKMELNRKMRIKSKVNHKDEEKKLNTSSDPLPLFDKNNTLKEMNTNRPKSIFDAFPLISQKRSPHAFNKEIYDDYKHFIDGIITDEQFLRRPRKKPLSDIILKPVADWLLKDEPILKCNLDSLQKAMSESIPNIPSIHANHTDNANTFRKELEAQREAFLQHTGFTKDQYELGLRTFKVLASICAQRARSTPLIIAWEKMKEAGMIPPEDTLSTFLYVGHISSSSLLLSNSFKQSSTTSAVSSIIGNIVADSNELQKVSSSGDLTKDNAVDFPTEVATYHDLLFEPTEKSISIRVKNLVKKGAAEEAELLLDSFGSQDEARLRTYLPIFKLYCEKGNIESAFRLFRRMKAEAKVHLEPETYVLLLATLAENGYFRYDSLPINGADKLGFQCSNGPEFFDTLMSEMADDVLEITSASARRLHNAFITGFQGLDECQGLEVIHSLANISPDHTPADIDKLIVSRVNVDHTTGICPRSNVKLRLIKLNNDQKLHLRQSLLNLSMDRFEKFTSKKDQNNAAKQLSEFANWLDSRDGKPFTAIVDGANVAYYMQNFHQGGFNYHQIHFMVEALEKMNENPLVILPYKYCHSSFTISVGNSYRKQVLSKAELSIIKNLTDKGQLYRVPPRCLDDYYWMIASISEQVRSCNGKTLDVSPDNDEGRWPGARPMLISNDQMRDHKMGLLEPRLFRRWFSCYMVNYNFTAFIGDESVDKEIGFSTADFFSREIQANQTSNGTVWHFPVNDWNLDERFSVRIPTNK